MATVMLRLSAVKQRTGLSRSSIYLRVAQGRFLHRSLSEAVQWPGSSPKSMNGSRVTLQIAEGIQQRQPPAIPVPRLDSNQRPLSCQIF